LTNSATLNFSSGTYLHGVSCICLPRYEGNIYDPQVQKVGSSVQLLR